jgi:hypothetical protein
MPEVIGIDHIYTAVADLARSERLYDDIMVTVSPFLNLPVAAAATRASYTAGRLLSSASP